MSKALLAQLIVAAAPVTGVPEMTLVCGPEGSDLAAAICASERLVARDAQVARLAQALVSFDLAEDDYARIGIESNRLRIRRDACVRRGQDRQRVAECLIFAYDRWLERLAAFRDEIEASRAPALTQPVAVPDVAATSD